MSALADVAEYLRRILAGEDADVVQADFERLDAERRAWYAAERERLQAAIDQCAAIEARHEGRLH